MYKTGSKNHPLQRANRNPQPTVLFDDERVDVTDNIDDRETDDAYFRTLDAKYHFDLDVAAAAHNAKCERYFTRAQNGLAQSWAGASVWCNPPYSDLRPWVQKAWQECESTKGIVMLLPANRCEQPWWQDLIEPVRDGRASPTVTTQFVAGRIRFWDASTGRRPSPPFGCLLLIWGHNG